MRQLNQMFLPRIHPNFSSPLLFTIVFENILLISLAHATCGRPEMPSFGNEIMRQTLP
jgi:hypothetical protein